MDENTIDRSTAWMYSNPSGASRSWHYSEESDDTTVLHTIKVQGNRFSHISETQKKGEFIRQRRDVNLKDVRYVRSSYVHTRKLLGPIIIAIIATFLLIGALALFFADLEAIGIIGGAVLAFLSIRFYFLARKVYLNSLASNFVLEFEMYVKGNTLIRERIAYGKSESNVVEKDEEKKAPVLRPIIITCALYFFMPALALAFAGLVILRRCLRRIRVPSLKVKKRNKATGYKFVMDNAVGKDVASTLGGIIKMQ